MTKYKPIPISAPWMIKYFPGGYNEAKQYTCKSGKYIQFVCPYCHRLYDKKIRVVDLYERNRLNCLCLDGYSFPEKFVASALIQSGEKFISQYSPDWIGRMRYDFYIPQKGIIIEVDGGLGHGERKYKSVEKDVEGLQRDNFKEIQAHQHGLKVIRVLAKKSNLLYMQKSIESVLSNVIDLSLVDYQKCLEYATNNLVRIVCEYYETHTSLTPNDIATVLNIPKGTIIDYIHRGIEIGWCTDRSQQNKQIGYEKTYITKLQKSRVIYVYKHKQYIGCYRNIADIARNSYYYFGVTINRNTIMKSLKEKTYVKGLYFTYNNEDATSLPEEKSRKIPVAQISRDNTILKIWESGTIAANELGYHEQGISACCTGKNDTSMGFKWVYATPDMQVGDTYIPAPKQSQGG